MYEDEEGHEHPGNVVDLDVYGHGDGHVGGKRNPMMTQKRSGSQNPSLINFCTGNKHFMREKKEGWPVGLEKKSGCMRTRRAMNTLGMWLIWLFMAMEMARWEENRIQG